MPFERAPATDMTIRTIIVDDEPLARRGLELRLQDAPDIADRARSARTAARRSPRSREHAPDLMFLDIQMPGRLRARGRGAGAAGEHADGRVRHGLRPFRDRRLRGARARLPAEAGGRRAPRARAGPRPGPVAAEAGGGAARATDGAARRPDRQGRDRDRCVMAAGTGGAAPRRYATTAADPLRPRDPAARRLDDRLDRRGRRLHVPARGRRRRTCCARR